MTRELVLVISLVGSIIRFIIVYQNDYEEVAGVSLKNVKDIANVREQKIMKECQHIYKYEPKASKIRLSSKKINTIAEDKTI